MSESVIAFCPACTAALGDIERAKNFLFCPFCRSSLDQSWEAPSAGFILGRGPPEKKEILFTLGGYEVLSSIGKGGMGEVFLVFDPVCGRKLALKKIRQDLEDHPQIKRRFLWEARVTSQLTHPAIVPIHSIFISENSLYYTMPYVHGRTLKEIVHSAKRVGSSEQYPASDSSIAVLLRAFYTVCQAVAYAHERGVLHRDLKLENVILGPYGQVVILDWGLAKIFEVAEPEEHLAYPAQRGPETRVGKVVGTLGYMAPERAKGYAATELCDVYALGAMLYYLLTLRPPFRRGSLKEFREKMERELLQDPNEVAPYREIPPMLSRIAKRCLAFHKEERYQSVKELLSDLECYLEGRSEWFYSADLDIANKSHWEFQENVLFGEQVEIPKARSAWEWFALMISKKSFSGNVKMEAALTLHEGSSGVGFLLSIPEAAERTQLTQGYCLWLGSQTNAACRLLRNNVEVVNLPDCHLKEERSYEISIEKVENDIFCYLDGRVLFSYLSYLPVLGTHLGILSRDDRFALSKVRVSSGSHQLRVSCLALPDAFLAYKEFARALSEYRRIADSFPGRSEGWQAQFRGAIALMEGAKATEDGKKRGVLFELALKEFEKLHRTPGAPLEYLGKSLVYFALSDVEEERKCLELALRRYHHHPLRHLLEDQLFQRLHQSASSQRKVSYDFALLATHLVEEKASKGSLATFLLGIYHGIKPLYCFHRPEETKFDSAYLAVELAFWSDRSHVLQEILVDGRCDPKLLWNCAFALSLLGYEAILEKVVKKMAGENRGGGIVSLIDFLLQLKERGLGIVVEEILQLQLSSFAFMEPLALYLVDCALFEGEFDLAEKILMQRSFFAEGALLQRESFLIELRLSQRELKEAAVLFSRCSRELLSDDHLSLFPLYGAFLAATQGEAVALAHFSSALDARYPNIYALSAYYLQRKIVEAGEWFDKAFYYEKKSLYRQLMLYYALIGKEELSQRYRERARHDGGGSPAGK